MFAACLITAALLVPGEDAPIHWGEKKLEFEALPDELPEASRTALETWHDWALAHAYRMDLDRAGRILLLTRASNDRAPRLLEIALKVTERFDQELPVPAERLAAKAPVLAAPAPEPVVSEKPPPEDPEDPEGGHPWKLTATPPAPVTQSPPVVTTWGSQAKALDTQTMVLFLVHDQDDFESLLKQMARAFPFLEGWSHEAKALAGFVLGDPLSGAYLENPEGVEEWNADNELVSRLARMCLLRRFGDQPNWFVQGYAWHMELAILGSIYVFPWRDEFVSVTEHGGWDRIVRNRYMRARFQPAEVMGWRRGKYQDAEAKASWGLCEYLLAKERAKLPTLLERLRVFREEHGRIQESPSTWRRDLDYEIPIADQEELFAGLLGADYHQRATLYFRKELIP